MFKNLFGSLNRSPAPPTPSRPAVAGPYAQSEANFIYQLLFCDDPNLFKPQPGAKAVAWQAILLDSPQDPVAARNLAEDSSQESRVRLLAYRWLKQNALPISEQELLGVIIEVPLKDGLDTIAAYADRSVRYIHQSGRFSIFEGGPAHIQAQAVKLFEVSRIALTHIGPWDRARLPAPSMGKMRMTFLVSDGLYFGEGPFPGMDRDPIAAPVIGEAGKLLQMVVDAAVAKH